MSLIVIYKNQTVCMKLHIYIFIVNNNSSITSLYEKLKNANILFLFFI